MNLITAIIDDYNKKKELFQKTEKCSVEDTIERLKMQNKDNDMSDEELYFNAVATWTKDYDFLRDLIKKNSENKPQIINGFSYYNFEAYKNELNKNNNTNSF